ncbi:MAG TPA: AAA family ATPase [Sphingobium sp.]|uniref:AAA family ATPase n=1 Tax=Sphingobium sp. TaxID=1912891 RepID=UPI002ED1E8B9
MTDHLFIITGGPGSGKTTLIEALAARGVRCMSESGRAIIQDQCAIGGDALPWADRMRFAELMLGWEMRSHREARGKAQSLEGPVIFDRAIPDVMGYLMLCGLPVPEPVRRAAELHRYNRRVFIAPYWPAIFHQDAERRQSPEEAEATFRMMERVYGALDYDLALLPLAPVEARADFVMAGIGL